MREWIVPDEDIGVDGAYYGYHELLRCKDCKHFLQIKDTQFGRCKIHYERTHGRRMTREVHYCAWAERKEE
jgi:hypothetical protein